MSGVHDDDRHHVDHGDDVDHDVGGAANTC